MICATQRTDDVFDIYFFEMDVLRVGGVINGFFLTFRFSCSYLISESHKEEHRVTYATQHELNKENK